MQQGELLELSLRIALEAAKIGHDLKLPLADSVMLASARQRKATLWTQDADFKDCSDVQYVAKRK